MYLYEAHLPVADVEKATAFYRDVIGLTLGLRDKTRDITFLWVNQDKGTMLGLWGPGTAYGPRDGVVHKHHIAFHVPFEALSDTIADLQAKGIETRNFQQELTTEPSVIGWMPTAQIYFRDLDGHSLEIISRLAEPADPDFLGSLSEWQALHRKS